MIIFAEARQNWRAFAFVMQVHENRYIKRAGVAGIRARASICSCKKIIYDRILFARPQSDKCKKRKNVRINNQRANQ
ncbi:TPA: hypothetical protein ACOEL2_002433 [Enterobacter hormaechei subsp. xiangfangensis]